MQSGNLATALRNGLVGFALGAVVRDRRTGLGTGVGVALATIGARVIGRDPDTVEFIPVVDEDADLQRKG